MPEVKKAGRVPMLLLAATLLTGADCTKTEPTVTGPEVDGLPKVCVDMGVRKWLDRNDKPTGSFTHPLGLSERDYGKCYDAMRGRNCDPIREESEEIRLEGELLSNYECDEHGVARISDKDSARVFRNLENSARRSGGNCGDVLLRERIRVDYMMGNIECNDQNKPEDMPGWGYKPGGSYYSPCGTGDC